MLKAKALKICKNKFDLIKLKYKENIKKQSSSVELLNCRQSKNSFVYFALIILKNKTYFSKIFEIFLNLSKNL